MHVPGRRVHVSVRVGPAIVITTCRKAYVKYNRDTYPYVCITCIYGSLVVRRLVTLFVMCDFRGPVRSPTTWKEPPIRRFPLRRGKDLSVSFTYFATERKDVKQGKGTRSKVYLVQGWFVVNRGSVSLTLPISFSFEQSRFKYQKKTEFHKKYIQIAECKRIKRSRALEDDSIVFSTENISMTFLRKKNQFKIDKKKNL